MVAARLLVQSLMLCLTFTPLYGRTARVIVADSVSHNPLPAASIFDSKGKIIGICTARGKTPYIPSSAYPITVRYLGFRDKTVASETTDTIFLQETFTELPEVTVVSKQNKVLRLLAYVREYSTLSSYSDTVFLFREKLVDFLLPTNRKSSFKGWSNPRVIRAKSYYRFTNAAGLDSVSDESHHHFSWSDWVGILPTVRLPEGLCHNEYGTDTIHGKYSPAEIWSKHADRLSVNVNVLADTLSQRWVPDLSGFFHSDLDFENFRIRYNYDNVTTDSITALDLIGYSFNIESNGRGHNMFRFNRKEEPFFVSTYAEVYIADKEFLTIKDAKKLSKQDFSTDEMDLVDAPALQPAIQELISRVERLDKNVVKLAFKPDPLLGTKHKPHNNFSFGNRLLFMLKDLTGISSFRARKNMNNSWDEFKREQIQKNHSRPDE